MTNEIMGSSATRRQLLKAAAVGGAGVATITSTATGAAAAGRGIGTNGDVIHLTVLGTTDLHGHVYNWDYFKDAEYDDKTHNDVGIAKAATIIKALRAERGPELCITLDAGDTIQGTPLAYYYAKIDPITGGATHPMAAAMNEVGYDAAALGNHEYNYGLDTLRAFEKQLNHPLLSANSVDWTTGAPVFKPYIIKSIKLKGQRPIRIGILGLVTPGVAIWDKANVQDKVRFPGIVEQAKVFVPKLKAAGCDIVIVSSHSGADTSSSYGDALPYPENASTLLAEEVPGIDAILVGHAHREIPERLVTNKATGKQVLLSEPYYWGMRVTEMSLAVQKIRGRWQVVSSHAMLYNSNAVDADPTVLAAVAKAHEKVRAYVNSVIGSCLEEMPAATSCWEDTAAIDFINHVQADAVKQALVGTPDEGKPVLSIAAPFNRAAVIPAGEMTVKDVAGLYIYDNTLLGIVLTGAQIKDYLEKSATYFQLVSGPGPFSAVDVTNAKTEAAPNGTPDYNYDVMGGLKDELSYDIDISKPVGERIVNLRYLDADIDLSGEFVIAINNYRQSGGGGFPHVTTAPVAYNRQVEIRQLLIDYVTAKGVIDPKDFASVDWRLLSEGQPIVVNA